MAVHASYSSRAQTNSGFTLLELAVVVTILGLITAIGLPAYARIQRNTRLGALINDYRVFASAFHQYSAVNAAWPAASRTQGEFPQGMEEYLRTTNWHQPTVFGGHYNWDRDVTHSGRKIKAAIAIYSDDGSPLTMTPTEMQLFDERYDDGDLETGYFQQGFQNCPLYIIEDDPLYTAVNTPAVPEEATIDDLESLPSAEETAKEKAGKEEKDKTEKEKKDKAANEAAERAAAEKASREAAEKAEKEKAAKDATEKAGKETKGKSGK